MTHHEALNRWVEFSRRLSKRHPFAKSGCFLIMAFWVAGLLFSGCTADKKEEMKKVTIGIARSIFSSAAYIAKEQGFFKEQGLNVTLKEYDSGKKAFQAMFAGEVDISTVADMPVVYNRFKRQDFCIFGTFTYSFNQMTMVARRDSGIRTGADLKGKRVGANRGTSSHYYLASLLIYNRLSLRDVKMVPMKMTRLPAALKNKTVDAVSVWPPHTQKAIDLLGDNAIILQDDGIYRLNFNLAVMKPFGKKHPDILEKILRAVDRACAFIETRGSAAGERMAARLNMDKDRVIPLMEKMTFNVTLEQSLLLAWDDIARWAISNKFVDEERLPNYLHAICPNALGTVKPESITIIGWRTMK